MLTELRSPVAHAGPRICQASVLGTSATLTTATTANFRFSHEQMRNHARISFIISSRRCKNCTLVPHQTKRMEEIYEFQVRSRTRVGRGFAHLIVELAHRGDVAAEALRGALVLSIDEHLDGGAGAAAHRGDLVVAAEGNEGGGVRADLRDSLNHGQRSELPSTLYTWPRYWEST